MSSVTGQAHGIAAFQSSRRSAPLKTATTPSAARAAAVSIAPIFAWAYGLRMTAIVRQPGTTMLSTNVPWPRSSGSSSLRLTGAPM